MDDRHLTQAVRLIAAARACLGTPFHHQGRRPGIGLDCIGLVVVALQSLGLEVEDRTDYAPRPDGSSLVRTIEAHGAQKVDQIERGDLLVFRFDDQPQHVALATGADRLIHSFAPAGKVVETDLGDYWRRRLLAVYRFNLSQERT